jgi:hypothetical protein
MTMGARGRIAMLGELEEARLRQRKTCRKYSAACSAGPVKISVLMNDIPEVIYQGRARLKTHLIGRLLRTILKHSASRLDTFQYYGECRNFYPPLITLAAFLYTEITEPFKKSFQVY